MDMAHRIGVFCRIETTFDIAILLLINEKFN